MSLFAILGAVLGAVGAKRHHSAVSRQRRELERAHEREREERAKQLAEEKRSTEERNRAYSEQLEKNIRRRSNRFLFSPSGGLGLGEDSGIGSLSLGGYGSIQGNK
jgi:Flp pilus assembly protein TadB